MSTPHDPAIERFLARVRAALPTLDLARVKVRTFGGSKAMADVIVPLIEQGEKTGTFALAWEFRNDPAAAPQVLQGVHHDEQVCAPEVVARDRLRLLGGPGRQVAVRRRPRPVSGGAVERHPDHARSAVRADHRADVTDQHLARRIGADHVDEGIDIGTIGMGHCDADDVVAGEPVSMAVQLEREFEGDLRPADATRCVCARRQGAGGCSVRTGGCTAGPARTS